ncbi:hypothetical protein [Agarilytica rhodophyticola]|nr:hypothetical protein [Agarilytica rhodophyticola]
MQPEYMTPRELCKIDSSDELVKALQQALEDALDDLEPPLDEHGFIYDE